MTAGEDGGALQSLKLIIRDRIAAIYAAHIPPQGPPGTVWAFLIDPVEPLDDGRTPARIFPVGPAEIPLAVPRDPAHGDLATSIAMATARLAGREPRELAAELADRLRESLPAFVSRVEVAGPGFLNLHVRTSAKQDIVLRILTAGADYGRTDRGRGERVNLEFVSANPTGPPVVVSARAAAFGSTLANLLRASGWDVTCEYYVNDTGSQVAALGASLRARWRETRGEPLAIPDGGYHGLYLAEMAAAMDGAEAAAWDALPDAEATAAFAGYALERLGRQIRAQMETFRSPFAVWFSERALHDTGAVDAVLRLFEAKGLVYEKDGARWFRATDFGDDKDRVVVRRDGTPTYFLADAAYHKDKLDRGFDKAIDVLGPDHHGHVTRMQAIARAIGAPAGWLEILLLQWVTLVDGGETVAMSKRAGDFVTMADLVDEVGVDVARAYFLARRRDSHLEFDLALAREQSSKSPVFYAQYASARIAGVLRKAGEAGLAPADRRDLDDLAMREELDLVRQLEQFPDLVADAAEAREPNRLFNYLQDVATLFHKFYHEHQIVSEDDRLSRARLALCRATRQVLANGLALMGVEAPERM
ncbi:MAG: arginine--tRNA ligase [Candidatus Krumholzibacteriota bacterium]|nr:arginine--tRNA ligase [Candidatus Krumholzibacteriota bacterium]